jgi:hypothetical protein
MYKNELIGRLKGRKILEGIMKMCPIYMAENSLAS